MKSYARAANDRLNRGGLAWLRLVAGTVVIAAASSTAFAQSTSVVGSFTKTTGAAPASQVVTHTLHQQPVAILFWTDGRMDETFSNATGVVFRAAASAGAASGNLTINVPAGTQANDVMIAGIGISANTPTVTAPAGWTLVRQTNNTTATVNALAIYRKLATASEPASYTWTISANTGVAGGIMSFSGVDLQSPVDVENGAANASSTNQAAPTVTTTATNEMVVTFHTMASAVTWTPPGGMTEAFDVASQALGAAGQATEGNYVIQAAAGATGAKTAVASGNADRGNGETLTLKPAYPNYFALGMTDGTTSGSVATSSRTGVATSVEARRAASKAITIMKYDQTVLAEADFQAWDTASFTLNWTTNDTMPYVIHYVAIGGPGVQAKVVNWQMAVATGAQSVTGFGFQPSAVFHIHGNSGLVGALPATTAAGGMGMGAIDSAGNQWATSTFQAAANPSDAQRGQQTNANIYTFSNALAVTKNATWTGWIADGFTLNYTVANANAGQVFSLGLKGVNVKVGNFNKSVAAAPATQSITGLGFQPQAVFLHSFQDVAQANPVVQARLGWGASDGSVDGGGNPIGHTVAYAEQDAVTPSNYQGIDKTTKAFVKINNATSTIDAEADVTSIDPDGFTLNWTTNDAVATQMLYFAFAPLAATEVRLRSFDATRYDRGTLLEWRTGYEFDNLGFNLYRDVDGVRTKINAALVAGSGLLAGTGTAVNAEQTYARWDLDPAAASASAVYWLEDLDFNGKSTMHGPFVPVAGGVNIPTGIAVSSDLRDLGRQVRHKKVLISHNGEPKPWRRGAPDRPQAAMAVQQAIAGKAAVRIGVRVTGWYRVGQPQLVAAGLDPKVDPRTLQLFVDGVEQAIRVTGEADGRFDAGDAVEFYATGTDTPFTDTRVYFLVSGDRNARRIDSRPAAGPQRAGAASFWSTIRVKDRSIYFAALVNGDAENWFGSLVSSDPTDLTIASDHLDPTATSAELEVTLQGVTDDPNVNPDHRVGVLVNGVDVGEMTFDGQANATQVFTIPASTLIDGDNDVQLQARGGDADLSLVDVIRLTYRHTYTADADLLVGDVDTAGALTLRGFASPSIRVVDITDPDSPAEWPGAIGSDAQGLSSITIRTAGGSTPRQFLAFSDLTVRTPAFVEKNTPSNWHAAQQGFDYVLVSERTFLDQARTLTALRQKQGYKTAVVDVETVYDEFNFGEKSPQALRDFLQSAHTNWRTSPKFVVLMGDATTDPRDYAGLGNADFVPTKQVAMSMVALETASDDWFVDFNDDGLPEIAIGRLSVRTPDQAAAVVAKIAGYDETATAPWTKNVLLVADEDDDTSNFDLFADRLNALVPSTFATSRISRGSLGASAHQALLDQVNRGQLIVDYSGHGSVQIWGKEGDLLTNDDVASWANGPRLPFVVAMNCLNGLFTQVWDEESLAEALQRAPNAGAVAVWASSSVTSSATQSLVNEELFRLIFQGAYAHLGEAVGAAKRAVTSADLRKSWIFFGDPAMRLASAPLPGAVPTQPTMASPSRNAAAGDQGGPSSDALALLSKRGDPIRLQDFSGDRRADIVTYDTVTGQWAAESSTANGSVLRGGNWGPGWQAVAADLNGDGRSDVVLYRRETSQWMQGTNLGGGTFAFTSGTFPGAPAAAAQLLVGDFNGDRRDDVLTYDPVLAIWTLAISDGRGGFTTKRGSLPAALHVQVADLNGDGIADLFGYDAVSGIGVVALSSGDGRFATTVADCGPGWRVTIGRFGGRVGADLLFYNPATGAWRLAQNDGRSLVAARTGTWAPGLELHAVDLDGDGRDDIFGYNPQSGDWMTASAGASGRWTVANGTWTPGWSIATGDLNGDGRDDVALLDPASGVVFQCITVGPGVMAFESRSWPTGGALVGRPR